MSHLSIERLAALADEHPTADELQHLAICAECSREREAHRTLFAIAAGEKHTMGLPLNRWDSIADGLRSEGLISDAPRRRPTGFIASGGWGMRAAAAVLLVASGVALGRISSGQPAIPDARTASSNAVALDTAFSSVEDAQRVRELAAVAHRRALSFLAASEAEGVDGETPAVIKTRLSALDGVYRTMREALNDAPYDPVINDFYLNAFGQREATVRQLNTVLPQHVRLNSF